MSGGTRAGAVHKHRLSLPGEALSCATWYAVRRGYSRQRFAGTHGLGTVGG